jgi:hypothetical protein
LEGKLNQLTTKFENENKSRCDKKEIVKYLNLIKPLQKEVKNKLQPKGILYFLSNHNTYNQLPSKIKDYLVLASVGEANRINWLYTPSCLYERPTKESKSSKNELTPESSELAYRFINSLSDMLQKMLSYDKKSEKKEEAKREAKREVVREDEESKEEKKRDGGSSRPLDEENKGQPCGTSIARTSPSSSSSSSSREARGEEGEEAEEGKEGKKERSTRRPASNATLSNLSEKRKRNSEKNIRTPSKKKRNVTREEKSKKGKIKVYSSTILAEWASSHSKEMKKIEQSAQETVSSFNTIEIKEWVKTTLCHILVNQQQVKVVMNDDPEHKYLGRVGLNFRLKPKQTIKQVRGTLKGRFRKMDGKKDPVSSLVNFKDKFNFAISGTGTNNILYLFSNMS